MTKLASTILGPADHGRRMSLDEFDHAEAREGSVYELSKGVVVVTDVPNPPHGDAVDELILQLSAYRAAHKGVIHRILGGSDCKLLVEPTQSERHPDLAIYKSAAPGVDSTVWSVWVPEIVIEVVSAESAHRDYVEKPDDYLLFGVLEYWIVDPIKRSMTVNRRVGGRWQTRELPAAEKYQTPLLRGFELDLSALFPD